MIAHAAYRLQVPLHERTIVNEWKAIEEDIAEPHRDGKTQPALLTPGAEEGPFLWML